MEILLITFSINMVVAVMAMVLLTLTARFLTVWVPVQVFSGYFKLPRGSGVVLTWGGLRGGISVALALSLPSGPEREVVLALTYGIVVSSILIQGLTIGKVASRAVDSSEPATNHS